MNGLLPRARRTQTEATVQVTRTTPRRFRAALALGAALTAAATGLLAPAGASAAPGSSAEAAALVREAAQELTVIDEHVHAAELTVAGQQKAAEEAAAQAAVAQAALAEYEPQLRAIAQSGYTGTTQSRVAAFLTSDSATDLVQQIATIDLIADHMNSVVSDVAKAQAVAAQAQATADQAAATAEAGLQQLEEQQAEVQKKIDAYQADFDRLSAAEQARVTAAVAGPALRTPSANELPLAPGSAAAVAVKAALAQVGDPYVWAGTGPDGYDCSGLTSYAYAAAGVALPHSSGAQSRLGQRVSRGDLQAGDLVFFYSPISHVGLYIGNGMMVHARTFGQPVAVTSVDQRGYQFAVRIAG
jgi:cell wall-associated NlpC family hydrolase